MGSIYEPGQTGPVSSAGAGLRPMQVTALLGRLLATHSSNTDCDANPTPLLSAAERLNILYANENGIDIDKKIGLGTNCRLDSASVLPARYRCMLLALRRIARRRVGP